MVPVFRRKQSADSINCKVHGTQRWTECWSRPDVFITSLIADTRISVAICVLDYVLIFLNNKMEKEKFQEEFYEKTQNEGSWRNKVVP
jgi:hypothetical protein